MHSQDCGGSSRNLSFRRVRINTEGTLIAIGEHRPQAVPQNAVRGCMKCETREYHFAAKLERPQGQQQTRRATRNRNAMGNSQIVGGGSLKFVYARRVGKLPTRKDCPYIAEEILAWKSFRRHDRYSLGCRVQRVLRWLLEIFDCAPRFHFIL
jgi:hypothetical protein